MCGYIVIHSHGLDSEFVTELYLLLLLLLNHNGHLIIHICGNSHFLQTVHNWYFHATCTVQCSSVCGNTYCTRQNHAPHNRLSVMWHSTFWQWCCWIFKHSGNLHCDVRCCIPDISKYHGALAFSYCLQLYCTIKSEVAIVGELV
jgi:hypothetical protein